MFQEETDCMEHCKVGTAYFEIMEQNNHPSLRLSRLSFFSYWRNEKDGKSASKNWKTRVFLAHRSGTSIYRKKNRHSESVPRNRLLPNMEGEFPTKALWRGVGKIFFSLLKLFLNNGFHCFLIPFIFLEKEKKEWYGGG